MSYIGNNPPIEVGELADNTVTTSKIVDGAIINADINASAAIALSKLASDPSNASNLTSGTVPTARLASGTADSTTFLRGDSTWAETGGKIVQYVQTTSTAAGSTTVALPADATIPQNTEGYELMTLSITPTSASNKLLIESIVHASANTGPYHVATALFQDSTADALAVSDDVNDAGNYFLHLYLRYWMTAGTTSSTTFKLRVGSNIGTCYFGRTLSYNPMFGGVLQHNLSIKEFAV